MIATFYCGQNLVGRRKPESFVGKERNPNGWVLSIAGNPSLREKERAEVSQTSGQHSVVVLSERKNVARVPTVANIDENMNMRGCKEADKLQSWETLKSEKFDSVVQHDSASGAYKLRGR
jgi:hypothetical protein